MSRVKDLFLKKRVKCGGGKERLHVKGKKWCKREPMGGAGEGRLAD